MSVSGHLICRDCKQKMWLGKWLVTADGMKLGFGRCGVLDEHLGLGVLNFLARHVNHDVLIISDEKHDELSWEEPLHEYENDDECNIAWTKIRSDKPDSVPPNNPDISDRNYSKIVRF